MESGDGEGRERAWIEEPPGSFRQAWQPRHACVLTFAIRKAVVSIAALITLLARKIVFTSALSISIIALASGVPFVTITS